MARRPKASQETAEEALNRAQLLVFEAWEARTARQRIAMAQKAIAISPHCADAYVLMAEHADPGSDAELEFWQRGLEAGHAALGEAAFEEDVGAFWGFLETRPYMRARFGLAHALWARHEHDAAAAHLQAMLQLNPNDNQGARYVLAAILLETGRDAALADLFDTYPDDDMANWSYTRALAAFRALGDTPASRDSLSRAVASNAHVPAYLTGDKKMPARLPPYCSPGAADEAVTYVFMFQKGWEVTPGALDWLRAHAPKPRSGAPARREAGGINRRA